MTNADDIGKALAEIAPRYGIAKAFLFGSYARGEQTESSDIDLVIDLERPLGFKRSELYEALESRLGHKVDLVFGAGQLYAPVRERFDVDKVVVYAT